MNMVKLASTDAEAVYADMRSILPDWSIHRLSPIRDVAFIKLPDLVIQEAVFDEEDNIVTGEILAGETRIDVILPDGIDVPVLETRVYPVTTDHLIY